MNQFLPILLLLPLLLLGSCNQQEQLASDALTPQYVYRPGYTAYMTKKGKAVAPKYAPKRIQRAIAAGNKIIGKPYRSGGGHGKHKDTGYDCSGSTNYVLHEAGMLQPERYLTSGEFLRWGRPGFGKWLTVYAKKGHVFIMIAGLRFDTSGSGRGVGPRWYTTPRACGGFKVRHVPGF